jgi:hypothetical protein
MWVFLIIVSILLIIFFAWFWKNHKTIKCNSILFISGAPKTGKSLLSIYFVFQFYWFAITKYYLKEYLNWLPNTLVYGKIYRINDDERPLIYSNIPLNSEYGYVPVTKDMITRNEKINDGSVMYLGEYSLIANSRLGEKKTTKFSSVDYDLVNEQLLLFTKLCGHQFNGRIICDSQTICDVHYSMKRVLSNYLYIHHTRKLLFHNIIWVQENIYSSDNSAIQTSDGDIESNLKWLLVPRRKNYKRYDYRCYRWFTRNLKRKTPLVYKDKYDSLQAKNVVSYVDFRSCDMKGGGKYEK